MQVSSLHDLGSDVDDGGDPERRVLALELHVKESFLSDGLPLELGGSKALAVATSDLAEDPHRRVRVLVVEGEGAEEFPETGHDLVDDGSHEGIEELLREVVDAELERAESLADEVGSSLEGVDEGLHEVAEVGEEDGESDGDGEDELGEEVPLCLVGGLEESIELLEEDLEEGEDLLVQDLESTSTDAAEEGAEEDVVRVGFGGLTRELE